MDPTRIGLFDLAEKRLAWADKRQVLLAQNIANISTPSYQPQDMPSFAKTLDSLPDVQPVQTQPAHLAGSADGVLRASMTQRPKEKSPDGNAVSLDEQLTKIADTQTIHTLVTTIYKKYFSLFNMALGRSP
jgi:flagellar basal-body rod protein FlgB